MEVIKIKLHSSVDLITNSSTVIFTYSGGSLGAVKDLVNEMLKTFGKEESFDDVFYAGVFLDDDSSYLESEDCPEEFTKNKWKENEDNFNKFKLDILKGEYKKPKWMNDVEDGDGYGYSPSTSLELIPKDEKYSNLASALLKYLYSTSHEATRDG